MTIRTHERGLTVVTTNGVAVHRADDSISQRVRRLQAEARGLAHEHVLALLEAIETVEALSADIADGGEAYPPGVRDIARRLAEDLATKAMTLECCRGGRTRGPLRPPLHGEGGWRETPDGWGAEAPSPLAAICACPSP